jgi:hypothetical protein
LKEMGVTVALLSPGWIPIGEVAGLGGMTFSRRMQRARLFVQEMGGALARVDVNESVSGMRMTIDRLTLEYTGAFLDHLGRPLPW